MALNNVIVIDNGSGSIKSGFVGDDLPRAIFPSIVGRPLHQGVMIGQKEFYVGEDANAKRGLLSLKYPIENGFINNWDDMEKIWHHTFDSELKCAPKDYNVLITDAALSPPSQKTKIAEIMFEKFNCCGFYVTIPPLLSLYANEQTTCIVVDCGETVTQVVPFQHGFCLPNALFSISRTDIAGRSINEYLRTIMIERGYSFTSTAEKEIVRSIKENLCYVAMDYDKEMKKHKESDAFNKPYELPDGQSISLGSEMCRATEILFQPQFVGVDNSGVSRMIFDSIRQCDIAVRKELYANIVLTGGSTLFHGFAERIENDLSAYSANNVQVEVIAPDERMYSAWIGGSRLAAIPTFSEMIITKEEYEEHGVNIVKTKCEYIPKAPSYSHSVTSLHINCNDLKSSMKESNDSNSLIGELLQNKTKLQNENDILKRHIDASLFEEKELIDRSAQLQIDNKTLMDKLNQVRLNYNELKAEYDQITADHYLNWSHTDIVEWIVGLDNSSYNQYKSKLKNALANDNLDGTCLQYVEKNDIRDWGVSDFKHRTLIYKHIQKLIKTDVSTQVQSYEKKQEVESNETVEPNKDWKQNDIINWIKCVGLSSQWQEIAINAVQNGQFDGNDMAKIKSGRDISTLFRIENPMLCSRLWREFKKLNK